MKQETKVNENDVQRTINIVEEGLPP